MLSRKPFISICIPAYKRPEKNRRLLESISIQNFKDYEIILTDDSPDDSVHSLLSEFPGLPIVYYKNPVALGTPANWNYGISKASGEWIKIMHDDDWFADENSLAVFAEGARSNKKFIVSRYENVFDNGKVEQPTFPLSWREKIIDNPVILLSRNVIGPPSVTLVHSSIREQYDTRMKWRVDMDYYIRLLKELKAVEIIEKPLVKVGISSSQVTNSCINMPEVELPEGLLMLEKYGTSPLKDIRVYDAWWRILRNTHVRGTRDLKKYEGGFPWPRTLLNMASHQNKIPASILQSGLVSKFGMAISYSLNRKYL